MDVAPTQYDLSQKVTLTYMRIHGLLLADFLLPLNPVFCSVEGGGVKLSKKMNTGRLPSATNSGFLVPWGEKL